MPRKKGITFDPADYDYMDSLDKDGWKWEFVRRNENYRKSYEEITHLQINDGKNCKTIVDCFNCIKNGRVKTCIQAKCFEVEKEFKIKICSKVNNKNKVQTFWGIPNPALSYNELHPVIEKPVTNSLPSTPLKIITPNEFSLHVQFKNELMKRYLNKIWDYKNPQKSMEVVLTLLEDLISPDSYFDNHLFLKNNNPLHDNLDIRDNMDVDDVLLLSFSRSSTKEELRVAFEDVLKKHVRPKTSSRDTKRNPDKWKMGLMVWDLRERYRMSFNEVKEKTRFKEDTSKKRFYRIYELIYGKKYAPSDYERPEIKKEYLKRYCENCDEFSICAAPCPDVLGLINQDTKYIEQDTWETIKDNKGGKKSLIRSKIKRELSLPDIQIERDLDRDYEDRLIEKIDKSLSYKD